MKVYVLVWTDTDGVDGLETVFGSRDEAEVERERLCRQSFDAYVSRHDATVAGGNEWKRLGAEVIGWPPPLISWDEYRSRWTERGPLAIAELQMIDSATSPVR